MKRTIVAFGVFVFLFIVPNFLKASPSISIYLYGNPFYGEAFFASHDVFLEESALLRALHIPADTLATAKTVKRNGKTFISLQDVANILHSEIMINPKTGIVDLYNADANTGGTQGPYAYTVPSPQGGATVILPPSAFQTQWENCSPVDCRPLNPLPPPVVNIVPLVGNPWYNYPPYAPDPYFGASNPALYQNYFPFPYPYYYNSYNLYPSYNHSFGYPSTPAIPFNTTQIPH
jgi:hypothetical protein